MMISSLISRLVILLFGNLYPAYASYKAVRTKNVKEYVKWMMYWIVFALFTCCETFTDVFLGFWFPFYYEIKIILVIWLLSPATKGSSFLYRKFVHPMLTKREPEIDDYLSRAKEQSYHTMLHLGTRGMTYATNVIMQTAIKGGGGIVNHLRRSYSLCDLSSNSDIMSDVNRNNKGASQPEDSAADGSAIPSFQRDQRTTRSMRKAAVGNNHVDMYFPEVDVNIRSHAARESSVPLGQIRSTDDISSGYSSADPVYAAEMTSEGLMRTSSVGGARARAARGGSTRATSKRGLTTTEDSDHLEKFDEQSLSSSSTSSPSWMPTNPTIPFYPSPVFPMCISSGSDETVLFSTDVDVIKNQLALLKAFQDTKMFIGNNHAVNFNSEGFYNNISNILLPNFCNFKGVDIINSSASLESSEQEAKEGKNSVEEFGTKSVEYAVKNSVVDKESEESISKILELVENSDNSKSDYDYGNDETSKKLSEIKSNEYLSEKSNLVEMEQFHDSLMDLSLFNNLSKPLSISPSKSRKNDNLDVEIDSSINLESNYRFEKENLVEEYETNENVSATGTPTPLFEGTSVEVRLKPPMPSRKGRYNKKKRAPLPPNLSKSDLGEQDNDEDDFQDAESDIISNCENVDDKTIIEQKGLIGPDLIPKINFSDDKNNESEKMNDLCVMKETAEDKFENDNGIDNENNVIDAKTFTKELPWKSNTPSFSSDRKSKAKSPSKLSKFLPKGSNVPLLFGFLQSKDIHSPNEELIGDSEVFSGATSSVNDSQNVKKVLISQHSNEDNKEEAVFIPLIEDENKNNKSEVVEIREMSQSPTARRRHNDQL